MPISQIRCHTESTLLDAVDRLARAASTCRAAVSYCGREGYRFFPEAVVERPENLLIVIDASDVAIRRGLTNPKGVLSLLGLTPEVRSLAGLHSKVFIFDKSVALVGSANLSQSSIERQYQMGLEIRDPKTVADLISWFDERIWNHPHVCKLDEAAMRKKQPLWPVHQAIVTGPETGVSVPKWHVAPPKPSLTEAEFIVGATKGAIHRLITEFRTNVCEYRRGGGGSCADTAKLEEKRDKERVRQLDSLWRKRHSWHKNDLERLFDLAFTHGRAAKIGRPIFARQNPKKVVKSLEYLFLGEGDPFARFEKVLAHKKYKLPRLGQAGLSFLMHLWNPTGFAIINGSIDASLRRLSVNFRGSGRKGQAMKNRTAAIRAIAQQTGLHTFGRVDHFLDAIGKEHIGKSGVPK